MTSILTNQPEDQRYQATWAERWTVHVCERWRDCLLSSFFITSAVDGQMFVRQLLPGTRQWTEKLKSNPSACRSLTCSEELRVQPDRKGRGWYGGVGPVITAISKNLHSRELSMNFYKCKLWITTNGVLITQEFTIILKGNEKPWLKRMKSISHVELFHGFHNGCNPSTQM